jgi:hypothetical protein
MSPAGAAEIFAGLRRNHRVIGGALAALILISLSVQSL